MKRVKKEMRRRLDHLTGFNLNVKNLIKATNCRVMTAAGYAMNVCNLGKGYLYELDLTMKSVLR